MNYFLKSNKNLLTYAFIFLIIIPIFGINFFLSFLGNIILLLFTSCDSMEVQAGEDSINSSGCSACQGCESSEANEKTKPTS